MIASVLTCMPSVTPLMLLGAGESTVSSWKTGVETSSCLMGLNKVQHNINSKAKHTLHAMVRRNVNFKFAKLLRAEMLRPPYALRSSLYSFKYLSFLDFSLPVLWFSCLGSSC